jgi:two-component system, cell cycle sensor histidine kinase and response regulator CckA
MEWQVAPLRDASGKTTNFVAIQRDVSERKQTESALQERAQLAMLEADVGTALTRGGSLTEMLGLCSEAIVRHLDAAFARIWMLNEKEKMLELQSSAGIYTHLNGPHGRVPVNKCMIGIIADEQKPRVTNQVVGDPLVSDQEWAKREGMVAFAGYPLMLEDRVLGVMAMFARHTLTNTALQTLASISRSMALGIERKRAEEQLRWQTALLDAQVNSSLDGILIVDQNRTAILQNQRFVDLFKIPVHIASDTADENRLRWVTDMVKNPESFFKKISYLYAHPGETSHDEIELKDGTTLDRYSFPAIGRDGKNYGRIWTFRDITERKQFEARMFQSQKMETVGKLAGGIAHEFNSILTAIIGQSELLLGDLPAGNPMAKNAMEINRAAGRAATLTRQLLAYGRKQFLQPETLDLNRVLARMEGMLRHLMGSEVNMHMAAGAGLQVVQADAGQIEQVIMNMAINAREAMPNGGKLTLETANVSFEPESVGRYPELKPGDYVMLAITDTGAGMTEEVKARVFEPFFTTKGVGEGTGLGLSTCYGIVKQSGGHISVYSEVGRGATFKIYLPQVQQQAKAALPVLDSKDLPRGTETILLVEDDPALREMAGTLLKRLGYTVWVAANGLEALSLKQQRNVGHIDLLFTDIVMPHMSGKELADRVKSLYPHTKILFTSAYTESAIVHQGVLDKGVVLLQKPFTPSALARKVRDMLDQPGAPKPDTPQETFGLAGMTDGENTP